MTKKILTLSVLASALPMAVVGQITITVSNAGGTLSGTNFLTSSGSVLTGITFSIVGILDGPVVTWELGHRQLQAPALSRTDAFLLRFLGDHLWRQRSAKLRPKSQNARQTF